MWPLSAQGLTDNKLSLGGIACLGLCVIFAIVVPAHNGIFKVEMNMAGTDITINQGIWMTSTDVDGSEASDACEEGCDAADAAGDAATDCMNAICMKCRTMKAFSIIGALGSGAGLGLAVAGGLGMLASGGKIGSLVGGLSSISYLIIFAIAAAMYNGKKGSEDSDCGNGGSDNDAMSYGASFALCIVTWILLIAASILLHIGARDEK